MSEIGKRQISWQGGEHEFCLSAAGDILAVEAKCGYIGAIYTRLTTGQWGLEDLRQPIRQGLMGAGMPAKEADKLVDVGVMQNPRGLAPSVVLAQAILEAVLIGVPDDPVGKPPAPDAKTGQVSTTTMAASGAQQSSESVQGSAGQRKKPTERRSGK